jgi:hypothetical protein
VPAADRPVLLLAACQIRREGFAGARGDELLGDLGLALQPSKPQRPVHRHHTLAALQPLPHHRDDRAVGGRLLLQRPGRQQPKPGPEFRLGQVGVGTTAAGASGQAHHAHQHGEQALDPGERAVGAAAEPAAVRHASPLRQTGVRRSLAQRAGRPSSAIAVGPSGLLGDAAVGGMPQPASLPIPVADPHHQFGTDEQRRRLGLVLSQRPPGMSKPGLG